MDFLKKHYEKILLGVVLVVLAVVVAYLAFIKIAADKQALEDKKNSLIHTKVQPLTNLDMTLPEAVLKLMSTPAVIDFGAPNRLFNPLAWQKANDGRLIPLEKVGPSRLSVTNITPLYLKITFESTSITEAGVKYQIGVEKEAANKAKRSNYCKKGDKTDTFTLLDIKGKPEEPAQLIVQMNDTGEQGIVTKEQPFKRVDGYMADLYYDLEKKPFLRRRIGATLTFNGEDYKIVQINQNEVILSAPNQKKWTIKFNSESSTASNAPP